MRAAFLDGGILIAPTRRATAANDRYWTYDQLGNWEEVHHNPTGAGTADETRTHNEVNELTRFTTPNNYTNPAYDDAGNMTTIPKPSDLTDSFAAKYDAWNRLVSLDTTSATYEYDGLHRRIVRDESNLGGDLRHFYYNENWQCVEERVGTNTNPVKQYVYHPYYVDAVACMWWDKNSDGQNIERYHYLHDANFNVVAMTDDTFNTFNVVERYSYSAYGEVTILDADFSTETPGESAPDNDGLSDIDNEFLYTASRLDLSTGLYQYRTRYYHAQLGRFTGRDWIGYGGGMNLYAYVGGRPTVFVDPLGLEKIYPDDLPVASPLPPIATPLPIALPPIDANIEPEPFSHSQLLNPDGSPKEPGQQFEEIEERQRQLRRQQQAQERKGGEGKPVKRIDNIKKSKQRDQEELENEAEEALQELQRREREDTNQDKAESCPQHEPPWWLWLPWLGAPGGSSPTPVRPSPKPGWGLPGLPIVPLPLIDPYNYSGWNDTGII